MTFEEFVATRQRMTSHEFGKLIGDAMFADEPAVSFLVYANGYWIEERGSEYYLQIGRSEWQTGILDILEEELYKFAATEGL